MPDIKNSFDYQDYEYHIEQVHPGDNSEFRVDVSNAGGQVVCTSRGYTIISRSEAHQWAKETIRERIASKTAHWVARPVTNPEM